MGLKNQESQSIKFITYKQMTENMFIDKKGQMNQQADINTNKTGLQLLYNDSLFLIITRIPMKPLLSAIGFVAAGSLMYLVKNYISEAETIIEKQLLKQILITFRKRIFSTLRQIAYVVNNIMALEANFEPKKISDIIMKDGGSGDAKLNLIQELTIQSYQITRQSYEASCNFYQSNDYEIRLLLKNITMDIELALKGTVENYNGPKINMAPKKVIQIYREILIRRMTNVKEKIVHKASNLDCINREFMIEDYLACQGIKHEKQSNQKVFISILEKHYREDADFRIQFENLEIEMNQFMAQIEEQQNHVLEEEKKATKQQNSQKEQIKKQF